MTLIILHGYTLKDLLDQQVQLVLQVLFDLQELLVQPALMGLLVLLVLQAAYNIYFC